jgi:hypothetical protein
MKRTIFSRYQVENNTAAQAAATKVGALVVVEV